MRWMRVQARLQRIILSEGLVRISTNQNPGARQGAWLGVGQQDPERLGVEGMMYLIDV
jgi:hypothetical protein